MKRSESEGRRLDEALLGVMQVHGAEGGEVERQPPPRHWRRRGRFPGRRRPGQEREGGEVRRGEVEAVLGEEEPVGGVRQVGPLVARLRGQGQGSNAGSVNKKQFGFYRVTSLTFVDFELWVPPHRQADGFPPAQAESASQPTNQMTVNKRR